MATSVRALLRRLRDGGHTNSDLEVPSIETDVSTGYGNARVAVGRDGAARLLLPVSNSERPLDVDRMEALQVTITSFNSADGQAKFIELVCRARDLEPVFAELSEEILRRVGSGEANSVACRQTIADFKSLLHVDEQGRGVTLQMARGLVGELLQLRRLCVISPEAIHLWLGPMGDRHDFRGGDISLEMKTSTRASSSIVISSIEQLESPESGELYLARQVLDRNDRGGLTVSALRNEIIAMGVDRELLDERLAAVGYGKSNTDLWNQFGFVTQGYHVFKVERGFPRLTAGDFAENKVPAGVHSIKYEIDLGTASEFQLDDEGIQKMERQLCQNL